MADLAALKRTAKRLRDQGLGYGTIAKVVGRHRSTVKFWLNDHYRKLVKQAIKRHGQTERGRAVKSLGSSRADAKRGGYAPCNATVEVVLAAYTEDCPLCERKGQKIVLDHCHETGDFRGWVCSDCNAALGYIRDNVKTLSRMVAYLGGEKCTD